MTLKYLSLIHISGVKNKKEKRVWIDSQTEEEILRGIREAKDLSEYNNPVSYTHLDVYKRQFFKR